jgi:phosphoribosylglycinamide formyltransferase-1
LPKSEKNKKLSDYILLELKKRNIEYMFTFGHHLLSGELLNEYKNKIICFHPSILPSYTGFNAIDQAVRKKENLIGNSAFFIDEGVDTGKVIIQSVKHVDNFKNNDYEAMLNPIVDMFYYIYKMLVEDRIYVDAERAYIRNADYNRVHYFPEIWS